MTQDTKIFDAIIIGGGRGGINFARKLAQAGKKTLLVEQSAEMIGGTCINLACVPTKAFIVSARYLTSCKRAHEFGIRINAPVPDWSLIKSRVSHVVEHGRNGNRIILENEPNLDFVIAHGTFVAEKVVQFELENGTLQRATAPIIVVNTGASPIIPSTPGLNEYALTSETIQKVDSLPEKLVIMGAGYIGLEFAQLFALLGSEVTLIDHNSEILPHEDIDVVAALLDSMQKLGVKILHSTKVVSLTRDSSAEADPSLQSSTNLVASLQQNGRTSQLQASHFLVAVGRKPNTETLNLGLTGVETDARGFIKVNEILQTSHQGIFAVGDVNGGPQFTHVSFDDHRVLNDQLLGNKTRTTTGRLIPFTLFTHPEISRIGLTEKAAAEKKIDVAIVKVPFAVVPRAYIDGEIEGFMKLLVDPESKHILGGTFIGNGAGNLIPIVQMAMQGNLTFESVRDTIYSHPTMSEIFIVGKIE